MSVPNDIILYHYVYSPYARRIVWYLHLRGINYAQCMQPAIMPRPDLAAINVSYRRIPILTIGRDIYMDTRLILSKLETIFPPSSSHPAIGASDPDQKALERLLSRWTVDGGVFARAASLIPLQLPTMQDPKFREDRAQFTGRPWNLDAIAKGIPESLVHIRDAFELLETTLLADGREWVFKTSKPSLGDIEAVWPFVWLFEMPGALPPTVIGPTHFPKTFAWIRRFRGELKQKISNGARPSTIKGKEAANHVLMAELAEPECSVDESDPLGLKRGDQVEVWPIDTGSGNRDHGTLVGLSGKEVVVAKIAAEKEVRLHFPRWGFRIAKVKGGKL